MITLVTGAARSGKSEWAEYLAKRSLKSVIYIATAAQYVDDPEWEARLQKHRDRRPCEWQILEVPIDLSQSVTQLADDHSSDVPPNVYILVDSLGTWLANLLMEPEAVWQRMEQELLCTIQNCPLDITFVAEETGWGVVPAYELGRLFRDRLGSLCRKIGAIADAVYLVTGGYAINLTQIGEKLPCQ